MMSSICFCTCMYVKCFPCPLTITEEQHRKKQTTTTITTLPLTIVEMCMWLYKKHHIYIGPHTSYIYIYLHTHHSYTILQLLYILYTYIVDSHVSAYSSTMPPKTPWRGAKDSKPSDDVGRWIQRPSAEMSCLWHPRFHPVVRIRRFAQHERWGVFHSIFEQWKKPWLVGLYRGLYHPVI